MASGTSQHQAARAEGRRLVDGAAVVVDRRRETAAALGGEPAAAAEAGHHKPRIPDAPRARGEAQGRDLVAPGRDAADAVACAAVDDAVERPLLAQGGGVEREPPRLG
jgi:hypothetical protein